MHLFIFTSAGILFNLRVVRKEPNIKKEKLPAEKTVAAFCGDGSYENSLTKYTAQTTIWLFSSGMAAIYDILNQNKSKASFWDKQNSLISTTKVKDLMLLGNYYPFLKFLYASLLKLVTMYMFVNDTFAETAQTNTIYRWKYLFFKSQIEPLSCGALSTLRQRNVAAQEKETAVLKFIKIDNCLKKMENHCDNLLRFAILDSEVQIT